VRKIKLRARTTDPETSHAAAASVRGLNRSRGLVYAVLEALGDATDEELYDEIVARHGIGRISVSGARTRRKELVELGLVVDSRVRRPMRSGRSAVVWALAHSE
jgi:hypothetical protein